MGWLAVIRPLVVVLVVMLGLGCSEQELDTAALATDSVVGGTALERAPERPSEVDVNTQDPFSGFGVTQNDVAATLTETSLWLVNQSTETLIVTARGGAASVVVDTVGAADSSFVRINTRALILELSARTTEGAAMGSIALPLDSKPARAAFPH